MTLMPFINNIGRSVRAVFADKDEAAARRERMEVLRTVSEAGTRMQYLSGTEGWKALQDRSEAKIRTLQGSLERVGPDELKLIQSQIQVLREVCSIAEEVDAADAARTELAGLEDE